MIHYLLIHYSINYFSSTPKIYKLWTPYLLYVDPWGLLMTGIKYLLMLSHNNIDHRTWNKQSAVNLDKAKKLREIDEKEEGKK